jgi:hypothetical protein
MTQTPQFNIFPTQPLDTLAQQQPEPGQKVTETESGDPPESFIRSPILRHLGHA